MLLLVNTEKSSPTASTHEHTEIHKQYGIYEPVQEKTNTLGF